jgi:hypothetical protein
MATRRGAVCGGSVGVGERRPVGDDRGVARDVERRRARVGASSTSRRRARSRRRASRRDTATA